MALLATISGPHTNAERRASVRRKIELATISTYGESVSDVLILDLSVSGLMIETASALQVGDSIEVELSGTDPQQARVIWQRETYYGCNFAQPVPQEVVNAALLRSRDQFRTETRHRNQIPEPAADSHQLAALQSAARLGPTSSMLKRVGLGVVSIALMLLLAGLLMI